MIGGRLEAFITVPSGVEISATNNGGGPTTVTITAGTYTPTTLCAHLATRLTAARAPSSGTWSVALSTGASGTGLVTIAMSAGTYSIAWTSTVLRDVLGFTANITTQTSATGTGHHRGLWLPKAPLDVEGDPDAAPKLTDLRTTTSPTGGTIGLKGTGMRRHRNVRWSHVLRRYAIKAAEVTANESLEQWLDDTQFGDGHAWFRVAAPFLAYWDNAGSDRAVGYVLNAGAGPTAGWSLTGISGVDQVLAKRSEGWTGVWSATFPQIVSAG